MRFLYIKVLQILNQMVDLMLRIVGHVPRDRYLYSTLGGGQCNWCPPMQTLGEVSPCLPRDLRPCKGPQFPPLVSVKVHFLDVWSHYIRNTWTSSAHVYIAKHNPITTIQSQLYVHCSMSAAAHIPLEIRNFETNSRCTPRTHSLRHISSTRVYVILLVCSVRYSRMSASSAWNKQLLPIHYIEF